jgi:hypothetical protein
MLLVYTIQEESNPHFEQHILKYDKINRMGIKVTQIKFWYNAGTMYKKF